MAFATTSALNHEGNGFGVEFQWGEIAAAMYQAYGDSVKWKNFAGGDMPVWQNLPQPIKLAWMAAAAESYAILSRALIHTVTEAQVGISIAAGGRVA